jgi:protein-tyrosine phosphatase
MPSVNTGLIDTHTHLLPGIDDGCKSADESLACARALVLAGYTHAFCTPHVWPERPENGVAENLAVQVRRLQAIYDAAGVPLTLMPGGELNLKSCGPTLCSQSRDEVISYGLKGKVVLFDFWTPSVDDLRERVIPPARHLVKLGLKGVLAHPERIQVFHHAPELINEFTEMGFKLQMNTWCLTEGPKTPVYQLAERLLKDGRYFFFGTDLHNPQGMDIRIKGLEVARRMAGEEAVRTLTVDHPRLLLERGVGL